MKMAGLTATGQNSGETRIRAPKGKAIWRNSQVKGQGLEIVKLFDFQRLNIYLVSLFFN